MKTHEQKDYTQKVTKTRKNRDAKIVRIVFELPH